MMITDEAGRQLAVTDLNGAELRALRVLSSAGMIPPPDEPATASERGAGGQGVLVERDFTRQTPQTRQPRKAALRQPRQGTATARAAAKAS